jgi:hypothetical protein
LSGFTQAHGLQYVLYQYLFYIPVSMLCIAKMISASIPKTGWSSFLAGALFSALHLTRTQSPDCFMQCNVQSAYKLQHRSKQPRFVLPKKNSLARVSREAVQVQQASALQRTIRQHLHALCKSAFDRYNI